MTLREARFTRGITQWDLAIKSRTTQNNISLYENGFKEPSAKEKEKIAEVLCCHINDIEYELKAKQRAG